MEFVILVAFGVAFSVARARRQQQRIALLARHLGPHEIETGMQALISGYLRVLDEADAQRQQEAWAQFAPQEDRLAQEFRRFAEAFSQAWADHVLVSTLAWPLPWADKLFPSHTYDLRQAFQIHAQGIEDAVGNVLQLPPRERAYRITAELLLMQHTCHWFCRSRTVASARLLARHQTRYEQVLEAVSSATRERYQRLITR